MLKVNSFEKRYEAFKPVMDRELERCPWINWQRARKMSVDQSQTSWLGKRWCL